MARPRKQTYTMSMYLNKIRDKDICNDAAVQRHFIWTKEQINELIVTVLMDDYIPPIILGEMESSQLYIVDGGQRSAALNWFRNGNYKITSSIEDSIIRYKRKIKDENENIMWEDCTYDIKNKTYENFPIELKKKFDEYQIDTVIHEYCDMHKVSKYIKRYNNHSPMNTNQKAFTYIDKFAEYIRTILNSKFFIDYSNYTEAEKIKGTVERVIIETVMCTNHLEQWKKSTKKICSYLNLNATKDEFESLLKILKRLEKIITEDIKDIFNSKDSFLFLTLFDRFTCYEIEDIQFAEFLKEFKNNLRNNRKINNVLFDEIDKNKGTKDKNVIISKLQFLERLMLEFLNIDNFDNEITDNYTFIKENVNSNITKDDVEQYEEVLDDLTVNIDNSSKLLDKRNRVSLVALVAYSFENDIDLDEWIIDFFNKNDKYIINQKENYLHMKVNLEQFIANKDKKGCIEGRIFIDE